MKPVFTPEGHKEVGPVFGSSKEVESAPSIQSFKVASVNEQDASKEVMAKSPKSCNATQEMDRTKIYHGPRPDMSTSRSQTRHAYFKVPDQPNLSTSRSSMGQPDRILLQLCETGAKVNGNRSKRP